jgi:hypothetical protein
VSLGGVKLHGFEIPERLPFGGSQQLTVHKLPGGQRIIQPIGRDERDIEWSGTFTGSMLGSSAMERANLFLVMMRSAKPIPLVCGSMRYTVIIKTFEPDFTRQGLVIPYRIVCVVQLAKNRKPKPSLLSGLISSVSDALGLPGLPAAATSVLGVVQKALPIAGTLYYGTQGAKSAAGAVGAAHTSLASQQAAANLNAKQVAVSASAASGPTLGIQAILAAGKAAQALSTTVAANAYVTVANKNLSNLST